MLDALIDLPDTMEVVLDALALTLARESANQEHLATLAGKDPLGWRYRVFVEAAVPLDHFRFDSEESLRPSENLPLVNISFLRSDFPEDRGSAGSGIMTAESTFLVDCYATSPTVLTADGGAIRADESSARAAYRVARLVRNTLLAVEYQDLGLPPGTIGKRWIESIESLRPNPKAAQLLNERVAVARFRVNYDFEEGAPQITPTVLTETIGAIKRDSDGQIFATIKT